MSSFSAVRQKAESLESSLQKSVSRYIALSNSSSNFNSLSSSPLQSAADIESGSELARLAHSITELLQSLNDTNTLMSSIVTRDSMGGREKMLLKRYCEIYNDYNNDYRKAEANVKARQQQAELFAGSSATNSGLDENTEHLLRERNGLNNSVRESRGIVGVADGIFNELRNQRTSLLSSGNRATNIGAGMDGVNKVIDAIRRRKQKDNVILGCVLAACVLFVLWYWVG
jgi:Golgi SNAP receptor complex protein 1